MPERKLYLSYAARTPGLTRDVVFMREPPRSMEVLWSLALGWPDV